MATPIDDDGGGGRLSSRRSPRTSRLSHSPRPSTADSGVGASLSTAAASHRQSQSQPSGLTSDLELLADSERQIRSLLANPNPASRIGLNLSYRRLTILPPSLAELGSDLRRLYLNNNRLVAPPSELSSLPELQELTLDHNCLSLLPASLAKLSQLRILSASYNPLCAVPSDLASLSGLTHLWLHACQLSSLPDALFADMPCLRQLGLNYNRLAALPDSLGSCASLEWLSAEENLLDQLPTSLANCLCLNLVNLSSNQFPCIPAPILRLLSSSSFSAEGGGGGGGGCRLRHLLLRGNPLRGDCLTDEVLMTVANAADASAGAAATMTPSPTVKIDLRGAPELPALPTHWKGITNILVGSEEATAS